jgi:hypothetical protein
MIILVSSDLCWFPVQSGAPPIIGHLCLSGIVRILRCRCKVASLTRPRFCKRLSPGIRFELPHDRALYPSANMKHAVVVARSTFMLTTASLQSMNAGRPTQQEQGLGRAGSGDRQTPGEPRPNSRAPGVSTGGSFPRPRESPQPWALLEDLPLNFDGTTMYTIEQIDVLWLKGRAIYRAFEVEQTTAV